MTNKALAEKFPGNSDPVAIPRGLVVLATLVCTVFGVGLSAGVNLALGQARVERLEMRVDTLAVRVDSLVRGRAVDSRILRALGKLRCREVSDDEADMVDLPCAELRQRPRTPSPPRPR